MKCYMYANNYIFFDTFYWMSLGYVHVLWFNITHGLNFPLFQNCYHALPYPKQKKIILKQG